MSTVKINIEGEIVIEDLLTQLEISVHQNIIRHGRAKDFCKGDAYHLRRIANLILNNLEECNVKSENTQEIQPK